jgi:hypothetical protein
VDWDDNERFRCLFWENPKILLASVSGRPVSGVPHNRRLIQIILGR